MKPNILLVVLDSVRAKNTSLLGYPRETTPFLEDFANEATCYTQARAPGIWSLPSHVSMFTGHHVAEHGITSARPGESDTNRIVPKHVLKPGNTIWETLASEHGYTTGIFSSNPFLTELPIGIKESVDVAISDPRNENDFPFTGLDPRTIDVEGDERIYRKFLQKSLTHDNPIGSLGNGLLLKLLQTKPEIIPDNLRPKINRSGEAFATRLLTWIDQQDGPWAGCLNLMDAHYPYVPESRYDRWDGGGVSELQESMESDQTWAFYGGNRQWWQREALQDIYDGAIRQLDHVLKRLIEALKSSGDFEETLIVITSDHGEGFGEPSNLQPSLRTAAHVVGIHDVLLHVPLVVKYPGQEYSDTRTRPATLTRFPAVVRNVLTGQRDDGFVPSGPVIASSRMGDIRRKRAQEHMDNLSRFEGEARAVYQSVGDSTMKFATWQDYVAKISIDDSQSLKKCSEEGRNVVENEFERLAEVDIRTEVESSDQISQGTQDRLQDLGYL